MVRKVAQTVLFIPKCTLLCHSLPNSLAHGSHLPFPPNSEEVLKQSQPRAKWDGQNYTKIPQAIFPQIRPFLHMGIPSTGTLPPSNIHRGKASFKLDIRAFNPLEPKTPNKWHDVGKIAHNIIFTIWTFIRISKLINMWKCEHYLVLLVELVRERKQSTNFFTFDFQ
jgi:hypothetical protein